MPGLFFRGAISEDFFIPPLKKSVSQAINQQATMLATRHMEYERVKPEQAQAIENFVLGHDVFVSLPTGYGKSFCFASLAFVFGII